MDSSVAAVDLSPPEAFVQTEGELDVFTTRELADHVSEASASGCRRIVLDVAGGAVRRRVSARRAGEVPHQVRRLGGTLELVDPSPRFQRLCRPTGLDGPFRLADPTAA